MSALYALPDVTLPASQLSLPKSPPLRPYQIECVRAVMDAKRRGVTRVLYVQATGCGKSRTFAEIVRQIRLDDTRPALVLAHREELLDQAAHTLNQNIPGKPLVAIERASQTATVHADIVVASIPTIARSDSKRLEWLARIGPSVIIYDECHHAASEGSVRVLNRFGAFEAGRTFLAGCTATPHRLDSKELVGVGTQSLFEECVFRYGLLDAIKGGYLSDLRGYVVRTTTDLTGVKTLAGDYSEKELSARVNNDARTETAALKWKELAFERPTLVFCVDVAHAEAAAEHFRAVGATAEHIHGGMDGNVRRAILDRFRRGITRVLTNCMIATEGFDMPSIACVVMLRPTKSWSLFSQMAGRATRLSPGKTDAIILDVVDNCDHHSLMSAPRMVDLPPGVDLDGQSLREAQEEMEALGEKAAFLPDKPGKWRDLVTAAKEVPLFSLPPTPPELASVGTLRWFKRGSGYVVSCGSNKDRTETQRGVVIEESPLGWALFATWCERTGANAITAVQEPLAYNPPPSPNEGAALRNAIRWAEGWIACQWPDAMRLAAADAPWLEKPASEKQLKWLQSLARKSPIKGFDISTIKTMGDANRAINYFQNGASAA